MHKLPFGSAKQPVLRLRPPSAKPSIQGLASANDRFKKRPTLPVAVIGAVIAHFMIFEMMPRFDVATIAVAGEVMAAVDLPPEVEIPPPPEQIARPATPRVAAVDVREDLTIAPTTFEDNPAENLGPPPAVVATDADRPEFIPYTVAPRLRNREEVLALLRQVYPRALQDAGISGTVLLWIYVDENGDVQDIRVAESSGYNGLDRAAQTVASAMHFTPAMNRDRVTAVWLEQPFTFEALN
jgi:protein TonB